MSEAKCSLPSPDEYLGRVFGEGGYLAERFQGYRPRAGQVALASAIDDAIATGDHLLGEGGTGVGKSYAYLVPATYYASVAEGEILRKRQEREAEVASGVVDPEAPRPDEDWSKAQVIVVTANIALQEQLVNRDLPALSGLLPWP